MALLKSTIFEFLLADFSLNLTVLQRRTVRMLIRMSTIDPRTARAMVRLDHEVTDEEEEEEDWEEAFEV